MFTFPKILLRKVFVLLNSTVISYRIYKGICNNEQRKKEIDAKCKNMLLKSPEVIDYFGPIKDIYITGVQEIPIKLQSMRVLSCAEYLVEGTKRIGKVAIRYQLTGSDNIKELIEKQNNNFKNIFSENFNVENITNYQKNCSYSDVKKLNLNDHFKETDSSQVSLAYRTVSNESIIHTSSFSLCESKNIQPKTDLAGLSSNLNIENKLYKNLEDSNNKQTEDFYKYYSSYLSCKYKIFQKNEEKIKEKYELKLKESIIPLYHYFMNYLKNKGEKRNFIDILIEDIHIKKNFRYYSLYSDHSCKTFNDSENRFYHKDSEMNVKNKIDEEILKYATEYLKKKDLTKQFVTIYENTHSCNSNDTVMENEYEYNYSFIEEVVDLAKNSWALRYALWSLGLFCLFSTLYIYSFSNHLLKVDYLAKTILKYEREGKAFAENQSVFYYTSIKFPNILNNDRYRTYLFVEPSNIDKKLRIVNIKLNSDNYEFITSNFNEPYTKI